MKRIAFPCFLNQYWQNLFVLLDYSFFLSYVTIPLICPCKMLIEKRLWKDCYSSKMCRWLCCNFTNITLLRVCVFFLFLGFLSRTFTFHRTAGKGEGYLFNSSILIPPASQTRTGNLWFPSASASFNLYVVETSKLVTLN